METDRSELLAEIAIAQQAPATGALAEGDIAAAFYQVDAIIPSDVADDGQWVRFVARFAGGELCLMQISASEISGFISVLRKLAAEAQLQRFKHSAFATSESEMRN
jgi:hypothetical protein